LELDPLSLVANTNLAFQYYHSRRYDESIEQFNQAKELDDTFYIAFMIGLPYEQKGMYEEAILAFEKAANLSGRDPGILGCLGHAYAIAGKRAEAQEILITLDQLSTKRYISSYDRAVILTALSAKNEAFDCLNEAYEQKDYDLLVIKVDPRLDSLHSDSRF